VEGVISNGHSYSDFIIAIYCDLGIASAAEADTTSFEAITDYNSAASIEYVSLNCD
jgi:hypothetical protein